MGKYEEWQLRVVDEKGSIGFMIQRLTDFMHTEKYAEQAPTDQGLLMVQLVAMKTYSETLKLRIERF